MGYLANFLTKIGLDTTDLNSGMDKSTRAVKKFGADLEGVGKSMALGITLPLAGLAAGALKASADLESLKLGLTAITGNAATTEAQLTRLKRVAELPGLGFKEAVQGSINLQAAGFSASLAERSLKAFGNALATVGKGKPELEAVNVQLTQMASKPKVLTEDLKPLLNYLPQIRQAMQSAFGTKNIEDIQKLGITGQEFIEKIIKEFEKLPPVTGGLKNSFENLTDSLFLAAAAAGDALKPIATRLISDFAQPAIDKIKELATEFTKLPVSLQNVAIGVTATAAAFPLLTIAIGNTITNAIVIGSTLSKLGGVLSKVGLGAELLGKAFVPAAVAMAVYWGGNKLLQYASGLDTNAAAMDKLNQKFKVFNGVIGDRAGSRTVDSVLDFLGTQLPAAAEKAGESIDQALKGLGLKSTQDLQKELEAARAHFETLKKAGTEGPAVMAAAAKRVQEAYEALHPVITQVIDKFSAIPFAEKSEQGALLTAKMKSWATEWEKLRDEAAKLGVSIDELLEIKKLQAAEKFGKAFDPAPVADFSKEVAHAVKETDGAKQSIGNLDGSLQDMGDSLKEDGDAMRLLGVTGRDDLGKLGEAFGRVEALYASGAIGLVQYERAYYGFLKALDAAGVATEEQKAALRGLEQQYDVNQRKVRSLGDEIAQMSHQAFSSLERDLAKNIVQWKGWADTIKNVGRSFAEDFLGIMLKGLFKPLEDQFAKIATKIGDWLGGIFGGGSSVAGSVASTAGGAASSGVGAAGSAASAAGSAASGLAGIVTAAASIGTLASSIVGNFQFAGMNKSLDVLVNHTLRIFNEVAQIRIDNWSQYNHMYDRLGEVLNSIKDTATGKVTIENKIYLDGKQISNSVMQAAFQQALATNR